MAEFNSGEQRLSSCVYRRDKILAENTVIIFLLVLCVFIDACNFSGKSDDSKKDSLNIKNKILNDTIENNHNQRTLVQSQSDTSISQLKDNNYVNDSFVNLVLDSILSYRLVDRYSLNNNKVIKRVKRNEISFLNGPDSIIFLKGPSAVILKSAMIFSNSIVIDTNIKIGVTKGVFNKKFNVSIPDIFILSELEGNCQFTFIFKNDSLYEIKYSMQ